MIVLFALAILGQSPTVQIAERSSPEVMISMAKSSYIEGEPIDIIVSVFNSGSKEIEWPITGYPFAFSDGGALELHADKLKRLPDDAPLMGSAVMSGPFTISPGQAWTAKAFLQTFLQQPKPGRYQVRYRLRFSYRFPDPARDRLDFNFPQRLSAQGTLAFAVEPAAPHQLERVLEHYRNLLYLSQPFDRQYRRAFERIQEVVVAFSTLTEPEPTRRTRRPNAKARRQPRVPFPGNPPTPSSEETNPRRSRTHRPGFFSDLAGALNWGVAAYRWLYQREGVYQWGATRYTCEFIREQEAIEALSVVDDPIVIPFFADVIEVGQPKMAFRALSRFQNHPEAQRLVLNCLWSEHWPDNSWALDWLIEANFILSVDQLRDLLTQDLDKGGGMGIALEYLQRIDRPEYRVLAPELSACLDTSGQFSEPLLSGALNVLADWEAPSTPAIQGALSRLAEPLTERGSAIYRDLPVLEQWGYALNVETIRALLEKPRQEISYSAVIAILSYIWTIDRKEYQVLQPQVAVLLKSDYSRVVVGALAILRRWDYVLKKEEQETLLQRPGEVRNATLKYLRNSDP